MAIKDYLAAAKQIVLIADTQKRQEQDIKELKQFMIRFTAELQRVSDRIDMTDARTKSDLENLNKQTRLELENLTLKMQLAIQGAQIKQSTQGDGAGGQKRLTPAKKSGVKDSRRKA